MSKSDYFEQAMLDLIFLGIAIDGIAEDDQTPASLELALHTADPGEAGNQLTSEAPNIARLTMTRVGGTWTRSGSVVSNTALVTFPQNTGAAVTVTHWSAGIVGTDNMNYYGALDSPMIIDTNVAATFPASALTIEEQ